LAGLLLLAVCVASMLFLAVQQLGGLEVPGCGPASPCAEAAASRWGSVLGWPVSFLGLAYFSGLAAAWGLCGEGVSRSLRLVIRLGAAVSAGFLLLIALEKHYCLYCLVAHLANLALWVLAERAPLRPGLRPLVTAAAIFALASALLHAVAAERERVRLAEAEQDARRSIDRIVAASRKKEAPAARPAVSEPGPDERQLQKSIAQIVAGVPSRRLQERYPLGPERTAVRVVVFIDYQCEHCLRLERELQAVFRQNASVMSISVKHFPLCTHCNSFHEADTHPNACRAARAAAAAGLLRGSAGFWEMHAWLCRHAGTFTDRQLADGLREQGYLDVDGFLATMKGAEALQQILRDTEEGDALNLTATPAIFLNGVELRGWQARDAVLRAVRAVRDGHPAPRSSDTPGP